MPATYRNHSPIRQLTAALAYGVLALGACSGDDDTAEPAAVSTAPISIVTASQPNVATTAPASTAPVTQPSPTPSTSAMLAPTTTPPTVPVTAAPGEPDWAAIVGELATTLNAIQAAPELARLTEYCIVDTACYLTQAGQLQQLIDNGWRTVDRPVYPVVSAELASTVDAQPIETSPFVVIRVTVTITDPGDARIVDADGNLVSRLVPDGEPGTESLSLWTLARDEAGQWRVVDVETLP